MRAMLKATSLVFMMSLSSTLLAAELPNIAEAGITPEEKGLRIAKAQQLQDEGWKDNQAQMVMVLKDAKGKETVREMRTKALEVANDGDKGLSIFDNPKDVAGTAFLTFAHTHQPDDQWLYLPALKRVKRINSSKQTGSFMGSEFSYEDMSSAEVEKYNYKYLRDESLNGRDCYVMETYPKNAESGYSKRVAWIDKTDLKAWKVEFYDRKQSLLKTLTFDDYQQYLGKHWRASKALMVNHQSGKSTALAWKEQRFQTGLSDRDFDESSLMRMK